MTQDSIEEEALALPLKERARLAERLLQSLDDLPAADLEALWLDEAGRRATEIDRGLVKTVSPDELERRVQSRLK